MKKSPKLFTVNVGLKWSYDFLIKARSEAEAKRLAAAKFNNRILPMKDLQIYVEEPI